MKQILNKTKILEYQKNRDPYLMIDFADEVIPGKSSRGYKDLNINDWIFKVHWENDPNLPGMLQIESLVQMSSLAILTLPGNKGKVMYLSSSNNIKFIKKVVPNCRFHIETKINNFKRGIAECEGIGKVDNAVVCKADFTLILPDELKKYNLRN
jgi:3-hydroxyacyl-[acyl-carrier-protein] dehydratase